MYNVTSILIMYNVTSILIMGLIFRTRKYSVLSFVCVIEVIMPEIRSKRDALTKMVPHISLKPSMESFHGQIL